MTQRKQLDNMRSAKENSVEIRKWLLICFQDLRGFMRKVRQIDNHQSVTQLDSRYRAAMAAKNE